MKYQAVILLKHGQPVLYQRCRHCEQLARSLSELGLCSACEVPPVNVAQRAQEERH